MRYLDRSRIETDWTCPRKRYWQYEHDSIGVVPITPNQDLEFGTVIHTALAQLLATPDALEDVLITSLGSLADPQWQALAEGQIRGFARLYLPSLLQLNQQLLVEKELNYPLGPDLTYMLRLDLLRQNHQGEWWYREWKTTGFQDAKWLTSWSHQPQCHVNAYLAEKILNIEIVGIEVFGLYKGRKGTKQREGCQESPLIWGWKREGIPGMFESFYSYTDVKTKGWQRITVWEDCGVKRWIEHMPEDLLRAQYPEAPPVFLDRHLAKTFLEQAIAREMEICDHPDRAFPRHFNQCDPPFGSSCAYKPCCFQPWVGANPLASGLYQVRKPHHEAERQSYAAQSL